MPGATRRTGGRAAAAAPARAVATAHRSGSAGPLLVLLAAALAVKAIVLAQLHDHPLLQPHGDLDTAYYLELARRVADDGPLAIREPLFVSPLYVYFLAVVFAAGGSPLAAKILQIGLGTAAVGLVSATARVWFDRRVALLAGVLAVLTGLFTFYEVLILQAALDPFLTALALYTVTRAAATERAGPALAAGVSLGLLALNRPNALVYGLTVVGGLAVRPWLAHPLTPGHASGASRAGRAARGAGACLAGLLLVIAPNALRNLAASGELVLISSHGGLNFYIGNSAGADGTYQRLPGITPSIVGQTRDATALAERESGRPLSAGEVSDFFYRRAWTWIGTHPGDALALYARKLLLVAHRVDVPLNFSYAYYSREEPTLLRVLAVGAWMLVPLGVVGLGLRSARRPQAAGYGLWASFVPVYALSVAAFFVSSRYRMPLLVPLCTTAAATILWLADRLERRERRGVARILAAIGTAAIVTWWPLRVDDGRGGERTRRAVWLVEQGRFDEALRYVEHAASGHSHPGVLQFKVGEAMAAAGRFDAAIALYDRALAIDRQPAIHLALGQALVVRNRSSEAVAHLAAAFEAGFRPEIAAPWLARALALAGRRREAADLIRRLPDAMAAGRMETASDLGALALELDEPEQAVRWLRLAGTLGPERADLLEKLGAALLLVDRPADAVAPLEKACRMEPANAAARLNLAVALAALGRTDEARQHAEEAQRLDPAEPRTAGLLRALERAARRP